MAIKSETFGSVRLTGRDARRFVAQVNDGPNPAAVETLRASRTLARTMKKGEFEFQLERPSKATRRK